MSRETKLIYIGDHFYFQSGTMMSCLYAEDGRRYDWGFVQRDLQQGIPVSIRAATHAERALYEAKLARINADRAQEQKP